MNHLDKHGVPLKNGDKVNVPCEIVRLNVFKDTAVVRTLPCKDGFPPLEFSLRTSQVETTE